MIYASWAVIRSAPTPTLFGRRTAATASYLFFHHRDMTRLLIGILYPILRHTLACYDKQSTYTRSGISHGGFSRCAFLNHVRYNRIYTRPIWNMCLQAPRAQRELVSNPSQPMHTLCRTSQDNTSSCTSYSSLACHAWAGQALRTTLQPATQWARWAGAT